MLLVVDVGNTQTHFGVYRDGEDQVAEHWRFATVRESTRDELGAALSNLLALRGLRVRATSTARSSPRPCPQLSEQWTEMSQRYLGHEMLVVGPSIRTGMPIRMDNPREVGADRLVNAVAAYERVRDTCVVVDFGTAITYDVVSAAGEYLGGIITPGAEISIDALYERAAKLPKVELAQPRALIGKSTVEAIRSGIVFGFAGQVDGIVRRLRDELGRRHRGAGHRRPGPGAGAGRARDDRRGRRPADADRAAADLGAQRRPDRQGVARRGRDQSASRRSGHGHVGRAGHDRGQDQERQPAAVVGILGLHLARTRRAGRGSTANTGASSISSGTSQASRASASISGPPVVPAHGGDRAQHHELRARGPAARAGRARARRPPGPAGCSGSPAAIRSAWPRGDRVDLLGRQARLQRRAQLEHGDIAVAP